MSGPRQVTEVLQRVAGGSSEAVGELYDLVYPELRLIARRQMRNERPGHSLQATELVHEVFMKLAGQTHCQWKGRAHFLAVAAQAMRRILVDHARSRRRLKRGGGWEKVSLEEALAVGADSGSPVLLALDDALRQLETHEPQKAQLVEMRFFGGLTFEECAAVLDISATTAARHWEYAQAWLYRRMTSEPLGT